MVSFVRIMAEGRQPTHFLDVCNQKFSEFLFNAEHKCLVWLREIEEEALKMFDSNFSTEPELIPKTPSQKKYRRKKRSSLFKDENKELIRKRLTRRYSNVKTASFLKLSPGGGMKNLDVGAAVPLPDFKMSSCKVTSEMQCYKTVVDHTESPNGSSYCKNSELEETRNEGINGQPRSFTGCVNDHLVDKSRTESVITSGSPAVAVPNTTDLIKAGKQEDASSLQNLFIPKEPFPGKQNCGEENPFQELVTNSLVPEGEVSQDLKDSTDPSSGSLSSRHSPSRRRKSHTKTSLVEKYSLSHKRRSTVRKSISRTIARKQGAPKSSSASRQVACLSSTEVFMDEESSRHEPLTQNAELGESLNSLQIKSNVLDASSLTVNTTMENPGQLDLYQEEKCSEERPEINVTDSQISNLERSARSNIPNEQTQSARKQSYKQALVVPPAVQCIEDTNPSPSNHKTTSSSVKKILSTSGPSKIIRPFRNFFQTMQKNQLLKSPGSSGNNTVKHSTPVKPVSKGEFVEKERQRLESLRKKEEAEQQRKQKVEDEKKRRLEEIKLKREERLRKALQARERVGQMEEEKKKRMGQKLSHLDERSDKVKDEKTAEEKKKKKLSIKKMEAEVRKQKLLPVKEGPKLQEQPEKWKTIGEIKQMLESSSVRQEKRCHAQHEKEKLVKQRELAIVTEEEEILKEEQRPTPLDQPQQEKKVVQGNDIAASCKWLNITAQKSYIGSTSQADTQNPKEVKSLEVNLNDYGMDLNSDDSTDDETQPRKPIPLWANGLQLNEAVTYQYYNPPDINRLFGQIQSPKLEDIFYKSKPRYFKRTSSAVWQSPPLPGSKTALRPSNSMKKYRN